MVYTYITRFILRVYNDSLEPSLISQRLIQSYTPTLVSVWPAWIVADEERCERLASTTGATLRKPNIKCIHIDFSLQCAKKLTYQ